MLVVMVVLGVVACCAARRRARLLQQMRDFPMGPLGGRTATDDQGVRHSSLCLGVWLSDTAQPVYVGAQAPPAGGWPPVRHLCAAACVFLPL
jgi:hypothetical protein